MPADSAADGLTGSIADGKANDDRAALRDDESARLVTEALYCADSGEAGHWPTVAGLLADEVYRLRAALQGRVRVEDDDTIDRVAKALAAFDGYVWFEDDGAADNVANPDYYLRRARAVVRALREETDGWVPGDPVYPDEASRRWCTHCLTGWTGGPVACPDCGHDSIEGCPSCGARDGCPGCINPPEESR